MSKVETTEEWENRLLRERAAEAARVFNRAVRPTYEMTTPGRDPKIKPAGSCTLLSIDGHHVAISAAHVLDAVAGKDSFRRRNFSPGAIKAAHRSIGITRHWGIGFRGIWT
jgi:hypothetical protein